MLLVCLYYSPICLSEASVCCQSAGLEGTPVSYLGLALSSISNYMLELSQDTRCILLNLHKYSYCCVCVCFRSVLLGTSSG